MADQLDPIEIFIEFLGFRKISGAVRCFQCKQVLGPAGPVDSHLTDCQWKAAVLSLINHQLYDVDIDETNPFLYGPHRD